MPDHNPATIIGMGCLFPKSTGLKKYWRLLYQGQDAITDVPESHWSPSDYFDSDPNRPDHVYCKRGGFLEPVAFDPAEFGIPPSALEATDTSQLLGLLAAKMALEDCGYGSERDFNRDRASVILGVTGTQELVIPLSSRLGHPIWRKALEDTAIPPDKAAEAVKKISDSYTQWQENSFPGLLGNVVAGRICNRLDLRGTNCVVDAACASAMSAVHLAILELQSGRSDLVVTGGVDTLNDIFMHMCFSKTHTLSATGDARPFSKDADGTVLGEGIGILVLKRLNEARKDGDRIYAVIKGLGSSSDGKSQSIYSPSVEGQSRALKSAYENAGISPATVELIEAHGTGTRVGDKVEFEALNQVFRESGVNGNKCALGSVKSMIGHTKASAGAAGLIKAALGLYHKVLPPTLKAETPNPNLNIDNSHFYLNPTPRPWFSNNGHPRRAGVSAFGFGGSNFHVVLEENHPDKTEISWDGSIEIIAFSSDRQNELVGSIHKFRNAVENDSSDRIFGLEAAESRKNFSVDHPHRLLMVCEADADKSELLTRAASALEIGNRRSDLNLDNIFIGGSNKPGKLAFVFPGQGSQYLAMGRDLVCTFPEAMQIIEVANQKFSGSARLSDLIFPPAVRTDQERRKQEAILRKTDIAQPAIGAISLAMLKVLKRFEINPDVTCGHSFGELTALCAAGWIDAEDVLQLSVARGRLMARAGGSPNPPAGAMLAVQAPLEKLAEMVANSNNQIVLANRNSPRQGVLSGPTTAIIEIEKICRQEKISAVRLPVSAAFHTKQVQSAAQPFLDTLKKVSIHPTDLVVFSNTTGENYPLNPDEARRLLSNQLMQPVEFVSEIENIFAAGVHTFVEIGPKSVLTRLISTILQNEHFAAEALDASAGKSYGVGELARLLCRLASIGHPVALTKWENPLSAARKSQMNIQLRGTNFISPRNGGGNRNTEVRSQKPESKIAKNGAKGMRAEVGDQHNGRVMDIEETLNNRANPLVNTNPKTKCENIMTEYKSKQLEFIQDAFKVVTEGLKSMQQLQAQTAQAHHKFLETQTETNRALQEMMKNTQRLAERSLGMEKDSVQTDFLPQSNNQQAQIPAASENSTAPVVNDHLANPINLPTHPEIQEPPPNPIDSNLSAKAANGYSSDISNHDPQANKSSQSLPAREEIAATILHVVSQLTGYPTEMLGLDMDIEAELGIDSIKRVEILSTLEEKIPGLPTISPDVMGSLKTLRQIAEFIGAGASDEKDENRLNPTTQPEPIFDAEKTPKSTADGPKEIAATLLNVVSQLTGYPMEMLGLDMDIEAELGIDSIKRVEILSTLEEKIPDLPSISPDMIGTLKTLGQIAEYLSNSAAIETPEEQPQTERSAILTVVEDRESSSANNSAQLRPDSGALKIPRNVIQVIEAPANSETPVAIASGKTVFVTDDNTGLSEAIETALVNLGINTVRISLDISNNEKQLPEAAGLIIVQDPQSDKMDQDLKQAFILTQYVAPDLISSASDGGAVFATVSRLDGAFGFKQTHLKHPEQGGLAGLAKTAAAEWKNVCCRAIDIAPNWKDNRVIAAAVVKEIFSPGPIEIGLDADFRCTLALQAEPYPAGQINIDSRDVIVISGGARGVTAAAALALAKHSGPTLVVLGRSPQPEAEPGWLSSIEGEASIKEAILKNDYKDQTASPVEIESAFRGYLANRQVAASLSELKATGANVHYYSTDVREFKSVQAMVDDVRSIHGPITAIIHGAGVLEDRLIIDKTVEQFERVFDTKVNGLKNLLKATREEPLKYLVIFSSVAARLGNKGQADYAMANEVLNKIAQAEAAQRGDCRVMAINWGPWDGGMVNSALKREFERNGIPLIAIDEGVQCMLHEMMAEKNDSVEVVIGAQMTNTRINAPKRLKRPALVKAKPVIKNKQLSLAFEREIDIQHYPVLKSHVIDGRPVVPLALIIEWLAHCALHENPGLTFHGLDNIRILKGIRLDHERKHIRLLAGKLIKNTEFYEIAVELGDGNNEDQNIIHAKASAILSDRMPAAPAYQFSKAMVARAYTRNIDDVYDKILFHGSQLHGIQKIISCSSRGMVAHILPAPSPGEWIAGPLRNQWIADPLVLDSAFQMATVWCFEEKGVVSLPSYGASLRQYRQRFPSDRVTVVLEVRDTTDRKMKGDFTFLDTNDDIVARLTGYEAIMDASLLKAFKPHYKASA